MAPNIVSCVIRNTGAPEYWQVLDDGVHVPINIDSVTTDPETNLIIVNYAQTFGAVNSLIVAPDETLARQGVTAGPSVNRSDCRIALRRAGGTVDVTTVGLESTANLWIFGIFDADQTDPFDLSNLGASTVATSGDYDDLTNKPTLGTAAASDTGDFATAAQGALADSALQASTAQAINAQTDNYTLVSADVGKLVTITKASAVTVTVATTLGLSAGQRIDIASLGAGLTTVAAGAGVTVNGTPGLVLRAQFSAASLICTAADTYLLVGDLSA